MVFRPLQAVVVALLAVVVVPASARAGEADGVPALPDFARHLRLMPSAQIEGGLELIPKGELSEDPWETPIVAGQFGAGVAINLASAIIFTSLGRQPAGTKIEDVRKKLLTLGIIQLVVTPLLSNTAIWGIGNLSELHEVQYLWPLAVNYAMELILVGLKLGLAYGLGNFPAGGEVTELENIFGPFLFIDYLLHGLLVPAAVTYFSVRSRGNKSMSFGANERPLPPIAYVAPLAEAVVTARDAAQRESGESLPIFLPLASLAY